MTNREKMQYMLGQFTNPDQKAGLQNILGMMSDDVVWTTQGPADIIPYAGVHKGKQGVMQMFMTQAQVLKPAKFEAQPLIVGADNEATQVFYMAMESVTLTAPPNNTYSTAFCMIFTFDETGLVSSVYSLFDTYAVAKAFKP